MHAHWIWDTNAAGLTGRARNQLVRLYAVVRYSQITYRAPASSVSSSLPQLLHKARTLLNDCSTHQLSPRLSPQRTHLKHRCRSSTRADTAPLRLTRYGADQQHSSPFSPRTDSPTQEAMSAGK